MHPTQATTDCYQMKFEFQGLSGRCVEVDFTGGHLSSDGGSLLLRVAVKKFPHGFSGVFPYFQGCHHP